MIYGLVFVLLSTYLVEFIFSFQNLQLDYMLK